MNYYSFIGSSLLIFSHLFTLLSIASLSAMESHNIFEAFD
ncbi:MAG: hypothetical protein KIPDCIKN_02306 [Haliscomenobacter sp.]|jgi:hypothetical protein|nr:hypothetical protein [Haliscomenobacter sp.]